MLLKSIIISSLIELTIFLTSSLARSIMCKKFCLLYLENTFLMVLYNNSDFKKEIEYYKKFMLDLSDKREFNQNNNLNVDLLAIRDEILALLNQFLYLLTLH